MSKTYPMTQETLDSLKAELKQKIEVERPEMARKLKAAVAEGDLKENANYHDAREKQSFLEGRILELQEMISGASIIKESDIKTITVIEEGFDEEETYQIVGATESNPREGRISNESPMGQALLKAKKGQTVTVETPGGELTFKIVDVK